MNKNTKRRLIKHRAALIAQKDRPKHGSLSISTAKNMGMKVFHNTNEQGVKQSVTVFEPASAGSEVYRRTFGATPHGGLEKV
jgi:hypothetical protein